MGLLVVSLCQEAKMDMAQIDSDQFECKNAEDICFKGPFTEKEGWVSLCAFVGSDATSKFAIVAICYDGSLEDKVKDILSNIEFY